MGREPGLQTPVQYIKFIQINRKNTANEKLLNIWIKLNEKIIIYTYISGRTPHDIKAPEGDVCGRR